VGYVANAQQTSGALLGIKGLQTLYPCIAFLIAAAILWFLYPLTDARHAEIVTELDGGFSADHPGDAGLPTAPASR
jgi:GPH family glycoside/pentoside/hexuronide:cation symporter